ncbi:hypothetical protein BC332_04003 [Capsicum chinense]|nr:hypothetical protein BC332_04003 [Capsicum chinense]
MGGRLNLRHLANHYRTENNSGLYPSAPQQQPVESLQPSRPSPSIPAAPTQPPRQSVQHQQPSDSTTSHTPSSSLQPQPTTEPVLIGGMILDINVTPTTLDPLVIEPMEESDNTIPGNITYASGGQARNVADCMSKLTAKPFLISVVGHDMAGNFLFDNWKSTGLSDQGIMRDQNIASAAICNILDGQGELTAAVASVEPIEKYLTPDWIENFKSKISSAPILMVDANLSALSLEASCQMAAESDTPVWFMPVSVTKSRKIAPVVHNVSFVSATEDELIAMANAISGGEAYAPARRVSSRPVESFFEMLKPAIWLLLDKGVKVIVITIGPDGVFLCSKSKSDLEQRLDIKGNQPPFSKELCEAVDRTCPTGRVSGSSRYTLFSSDFYAVHIPALSVLAVSVDGAAECLVGGTIAALCAGLDVLQSVAVGTATAKFSLEIESNVPREFSLDKVTVGAGYLYSRMSTSIGPLTNQTQDHAARPTQNKRNNLLLYQSNK